MFRKPAEAEPAPKSDSKERAPRPRGWRNTMRKGVAGLAIAGSAMTLAACGDDVSANPNSPSPTVTASETLNPGNGEAPIWEAETVEQRYQRYYDAAVIPAGLSTDELAEAITDRFVKWQNLSLVEPDIQAIAEQMGEAGLRISEEGSEYFSEVHISAFEDALVDTSKSTTNNLGILVMNTSEEARSIFIPNASPDSYDEEPYRTYIDWSNASETVDQATGRRIITVTWDKWNNSDKNFMDDYPDKDEHLMQSTFTVDESEGRAVITDASIVPIE